MSEYYNLPVPFFSQREITCRWKQIGDDGNLTGATASLADKRMPMQIPDSRSI
jgi:hypothetical protein